MKTVGVQIKLQKQSVKECLIEDILKNEGSVLFGPQQSSYLCSADKQN